LFNHKKIYKSDVQLALLEDLGDKDLSDGIIRDQIVTAFLKAKDDGLFCGRDWFEESFTQIDKKLNLSGNSTMVIFLRMATKLLKLKVT
jgi:nicotinate-nucleotide pyrophosphorylase